MRGPLLVLGLLYLSFGIINSKGFLPIDDQEDKPAETGTERYYSKALIRSASGCRLNKLPQAKSFLTTHAHDYGLTIDWTGGDPRIVFFDQSNTEVLTINIATLNPEEIKEILEDRGFFKLTGVQGR